MPGFVAVNRARTWPFRPVATTLFRPGPTIRIRAPRTGRPAALTVKTTTLCAPASTVWVLIVSVVHTSLTGFFVAFGFGLGLGFGFGFGFGVGFGFVFGFTVGGVN